MFIVCSFFVLFILGRIFERILKFDGYLYVRSDL